MFTKINTRRIISDHFRTIYSAESRGKKSEVVLFFILPALIAIPTAIFSPLSEGFANLVATIMSIFSGLLLNVQVLVCDIKIKLSNRVRDDQKETDSNKKMLDSERQNLSDLQELARQMYTNISFCLLSSVISLIFLFFWFVCRDVTVVNNILSFACYYLVMVFLLSFLMVIKRSYSLISIGLMK